MLKMVLRGAPSGPILTGGNTGDVVTKNTDGSVSFQPGGGGGGAVSSVFGRAGAVVAGAGDYDASEVTNDSTVAGATVAAALNTVHAEALPGETNDGNTGAAKTIDLTAGSPNRLATVNANTLLTFTPPATARHLQVRMVQDGAGGHSIGFSTAIVWFTVDNAPPEWNTAPGGKNLLNLYWTGTEFWGMGAKGP